MEWRAPWTEPLLCSSSTHLTGPGSTAGAVMGLQHAAWLWPRAGWWACQGDCRGGRSARRSNNYHCLQQVAGRKERANPAKRWQEIPPSTASFSFSLIVNRIGRGTRQISQWLYWWLCKRVLCPALTALLRGTVGQWSPSCAPSCYTERRGQWESDLQCPLVLSHALHLKKKKSSLTPFHAIMAAATPRKLFASATCAFLNNLPQGVPVEPLKPTAKLRRGAWSPQP